MKLQPEPSAVLSQLAQRQQQSSILPTTEPLGLSQLHAPQVPTPPGRLIKLKPSSSKMLTELLCRSVIFVQCLCEWDHCLCSPSGHESSVPPVRNGPSPGVKLPGLEPQLTEAPQRQLKAQRRRVPPPSKVGACHKSNVTWKKLEAI